MKLVEAIKSIPAKLAVMSPRKLILLAFVLSVLVAGIIYIVLTGFLAPKPEPATASPRTVNVVVAAVDIPERTRITKDMLKTISVPKEIVPESAIRTTDDAVGKTAYTTILKEDVLTSQKVSSSRAGFVGTIPPDTRAITIPMNDLTGVSGFVQPGDYVDIFLVSDKSYKNAIYGKVVLQNVLVLAINKSYASPEANTSAPQAAGEEAKAQAKQASSQPTAAAGTVSMVTIAVAPADVLKIEAALHEGTLYMALRPDTPSDEYSVVPDYFQYTAGGKEEQEAKTQQAARQPAPAPAPAYTPAPDYAPSSYQPSVSIAPAEPSQDVQVIRGNSVSNQTVK